MGKLNIRYLDIEELHTRTIPGRYIVFNEGNTVLEIHITHERNSQAAKMAKEWFKRRHQGRLFCEICSFDFSKTYGDRGEGFIEAHHTKPVASMQPGDVTKIEDFVMVCSNCHSMLHAGLEHITHEQLKKIVASLRESE